MQPAHVSEFTARLYLEPPQATHTRSPLVWHGEVCLSNRVHSLQVWHVLSLARAYLPAVHATQLSVAAPSCTMLPASHWGHSSFCDA